MHAGPNVPDVPGVGGGEDSCKSIDDPTCQVWCHYVSPTVTMCQLVGGYSTGDVRLGVTVTGGRGYFVPGYIGKPGRLSVPTVFIVHESHDTCTEPFDVCATFDWMNKICSGYVPKDCFACTKISCNACDDPPAFAAVQPGDVEVTPETTFYVTVSGGLPPFTWESDDAVMADEVTESRTNSGVLNAAVCGPFEVVVTDVCDQEVTIYLRSSDGEWDIAYDVCEGGASPPLSAILISGKTRYVEKWCNIFAVRDCAVECPLKDGCVCGIMTTMPTEDDERFKYCPDCVLGHQYNLWVC